MKFFNQLIKLELVAVVGLVAYWLHKDAVEERERKAYANLSREELLKIALTDPDCCKNYWNYRAVMSEEAAAEFVVDNWLIRHGISRYRD